MRFYTREFETLFGAMIVAVDQDDRVVRLVFPNEHEAWNAEIARKGHEVVSDSARTDFAVAQLNEYFAQKRRIFDLRLKPNGTAFQQKVWNALRTIPYGQTISYGELAQRIGSPAAVRAVGAANGANPIPIIVPCHRVIGADGSLTGFGGGLELKEALLKLEGASHIHQRQPHFQPALF